MGMTDQLNRLAKAVDNKTEANAVDNKTEANAEDSVENILRSLAARDGDPREVIEAKIAAVDELINSKATMVDKVTAVETLEGLNAVIELIPNEGDSPIDKLVQKTLELKKRAGIDLTMTESLGELAKATKSETVAIDQDTLELTGVDKIDKLLKLKAKGTPLTFAQQTDLNKWIEEANREKHRAFVSAQTSGLVY